MILFPLPDSQESELPWLPTAGCLLAGLLTAALTSPWTAGRPFPPMETALRVAFLVLLVTGVTAVVARIAFPHFSACPDERAAAAALLSGVVGVWLVPVVIWVAQRRAWATLAAFVLGWAAASLLRQGAAVAGDATEGLSGASPLTPFSTSGRRACAVGAAAALQVSCFVQLAGSGALAALLAGAGAFLLGATVQAAARPAPTSPGRLRVRFACGALCAVVLGTLAMVRAPVPSVTANSRGESGGVGAFDPSLLSGAILLAETPRHKELVAPVPARRTTAVSHRAKPPAAIEFSGVYWIHPVPWSRPPQGAQVMRTTPITYNFSTVDRTALVMQAHQQLPSPIDPRCCSAVEVVVRNADVQPETISLEVILSTSASPRGPRQKLGILPIAGAGTSVLRFPIPTRPDIQSFDRIVIDYQLAGRRMHRSANAAILRFVLVPRVL